MAVLTMGLLMRLLRLLFSFFSFLLFSDSMTSGLDVEGIPLMGICQCLETFFDHRDGEDCYRCLWRRARDAAQYLVMAGQPHHEGNPVRSRTALLGTRCP